MNNKVKSIITVCLCAVFFLGIFSFQIVKPSKDISETERRELAKFPEISADALISGKFTEKFEDYSMDQFPMRNTLRSVKALSSKYIFRQKDNGGLYTQNGYISKLEYPLDKSSLDNAGAKFRRIYDKYLADSNTNVYLSIIPDKNFFMSEGYPTIDYNEFVDELTGKTEYMKYIDISDLLELEDYYKTDTHWRQEKIVDVADRLATEMGAEISDDYDIRLLDKDFYGVYYGQAALPLPAEELYYCESSILDECTVFDFESNSEIGIYDMELAHGKDPYEIFLSGPRALQTIKNPNADNDKKLIVFRDSFASSLAPLLATGYSEITLVDIRYISSEIIGNMIDFENSDVLFIYSTLVLNNSITLK